MNTCPVCSRSLRLTAGPFGPELPQHADESRIGLCGGSGYVVDTPEPTGELVPLLCSACDGRRHLGHNHPASALGPREFCTGYCRGYESPACDHCEGEGYEPCGLASCRSFATGHVDKLPMCESCAAARKAA